MILVDGQPAAAQKQTEGHEQTSILANLALRAGMTLAVSYRPAGIISAGRKMPHANWDVILMSKHTE